MNQMQIGLEIQEMFKIENGILMEFIAANQESNKLKLGS